MLIGMELPIIMDGLENYTLGEAIGYGLIVSGVVIVTRIGFTLFSSVFTKFISRFITTADNNPGWRGPLIIGWAGMRGVVSLAAALSIPLLLENGTAFPHRNLILFITFVVIFVTLVVQGLTFPFIIRWVNYQDPDNMLSFEEQDAAIHRQLLAASLHTLDEKYSNQLAQNKLLADLKTRMQHDAKALSEHLEDSHHETEKEMVEEFHRIFTDLVKIQRSELRKFRTKEGYDDHVIRRHEIQMDLEEERVKHKFASFLKKPL